MKNFLVLSALLPLTVAAQQEPTTLKISDCYQAVWSDTRASPAASRLGIGQSTISLALRTSKAKANAKERESLEFVVAGLNNCQKQDQPNRVNFHPLAKQTLDELESGYRSILAKTFAGELTWGASIEAAEENSKNFQRRWAERSAAVEAQQAAQAEVDAAAKAFIAAQAEEKRKADLQADLERQQRADAQQRYAEQLRQEQAKRDIMNGLLLMNAARPQPAFTCRSTKFFDTVTTNCN